MMRGVLFLGPIGGPTPGANGINVPIKPRERDGY